AKHQMSAVLFTSLCSRSLPEQSANQQSLQQNERDTANDVDLVRLPDCWLSVDEDTATGKGALLKPPTLEGSPIEHVGALAHFDRDVAWSFAVEYPYSHFPGDTTVVRPIHQDATHSSRPEIDIVH